MARPRDGAPAPRAGRTSMCSMPTAAPPTPQTSPPEAPARKGRASRGRPLDWALALLAHLLVGASWVVTALAVMGSLDVARRMVMNSEFAYDTGRLPQPWVIPIGLVAAWLSHRFFLWAMRRAGGGTLPWGGRAIAWAGALMGVLLGAYLWTPALQVGAQVGPSSGQLRPWGLLGWAAHYATLALPAIVGIVTLGYLFLSRYSPVVVILRALVRWVRGGGVRRQVSRFRPRREVATDAGSAPEA